MKVEGINWTILDTYMMLGMYAREQRDLCHHLTTHTRDDKFGNQIYSIPISRIEELYPRLSEYSTGISQVNETPDNLDMGLLILFSWVKSHGLSLALSSFPKTLELFTFNVGWKDFKSGSQEFRADSLRLPILQTRLKEYEEAWKITP